MFIFRPKSKVPFAAVASISKWLDRLEKKKYWHVKNELHLVGNLYRLTEKEN